MTDQPFEELAEQAASGLKGDQELYLDVKQELRSHLEEKAEKFAHEGHAEDESADLAKKCFGSPLDVAADLLNANKRRMKLRALFRLAFGALIVPVAILLALYLGYGRFARLENMVSSTITDGGDARLPTLPFLNYSSVWGERGKKSLPGVGDSRDRLDYWKAHKSDPENRRYYAYYAALLRTDYFRAQDEPQYVDAMHMGERIEPQNALYNVLLADYYLKRGISTRHDKPKQDGVAQTDDILDRRYFDLGIAELMKAVGKPYLHTYQLDMIRKRNDSMPHPLFTEDYLARIAISAAELFPHLARYRDLARKIPGCARILLSEGCRAEARAVMDAWGPYTRLLLSDPSPSMINSLVTTASGMILTKEAPEVYNALGEVAKAQDAGRTYRLLKSARDARKSGMEKERSQDAQYVERNGSFVAGILFPVFGGPPLTKEDLAPSRMHEYTVAEELSLNALLTILAIVMIGTVLQGTFWLLRQRKAQAVPLMLALPAKVILRALLLGILLPMVVYWIYSRVPVISGRELSLQANWIRFALEMLTLAIVMFWVPVRIVRLYIRRRCDDLDIPLPQPKIEATTEWVIRAMLFALCLLAAIAYYIPNEDENYTFWMVLFIGIAIALVLCVALYTDGKRRQNGLYFGTMARSLATMYAFSILLISLTVQPWMMYNEVKLLRQDKLIFGYLSDNRNPVGFTLMEARAVESYNADLRKALEDN